MNRFCENEKCYLSNVYIPENHNFMSHEKIGTVKRERFDLKDGHGSIFLCDACIKEIRISS